MSDLPEEAKICIQKLELFLGLYIMGGSIFKGFRTFLPYNCTRGEKLGKNVRKKAYEKEPQKAVQKGYEKEPPEAQTVLIVYELSASSWEDFHPSPPLNHLSS